MFIKDDKNLLFAKKLIIILVVLMFAVFGGIYYIDKTASLKDKQPTVTFVQKEQPKGTADKSPYNIFTSKVKSSRIFMINKIDGGYMISGDVKGGDSLSFFMEVDEEGREIWSKTISKTYIGGKLIAAKMDTYFVVGYYAVASSSDETFFIDKQHKIFAKLPYGFEHIISLGDEFIAVSNTGLCRFDKNQNIIWQINEYFADNVHELIATKDGNFIVATKNNGVVKFDQNGKIIWHSEYKLQKGFIGGIVEGNDEAIYMIHKIKNAKEQAVIVKIDKNGKTIGSKVVFEHKDYFNVKFSKYGKDKFLMVASARENFKDDIKLLEIDSDLNAVAQKDMVLVFGNSLFISTLTLMPNLDVLMAGSAEIIKELPDIYIKDYERYKQQPQSITMGFIIRLDHTKNLDAQNFSLKK